MRLSARFPSAFGWAAAALLSVAGSASAQMTGAPMAGYLARPGVSSSTMPTALREIGFDQRLDNPLPLDTQFFDEQGKTVRLGEYFGKRPVVLGFVYYECPMLCTQVLGAMASTFSMVTLEPGADYEVVLVSFDPRETPKQATTRKTEYMHRLKNPKAEQSWHFLTGQQPDIERLTKAAGFRYAWDEETKQYAHPAGIIVVTPDGRPARYLFGVEYGPRDVRLALVEASKGKIGSLADNLLLFCYHYDPMTGRYGFVIMRMLRVAGVATVLLIAASILLMVRRERLKLRTPDLAFRTR